MIYVSLTSLNHSNKLIESKEGVLGNYNVWLVGQKHREHPGHEVEGSLGGLNPYPVRSDANSK